MEAVLPTQAPAIQRLIALPLSERRDALEALVVAEFKTTLLMTVEDELPSCQSFFDLGLTSLGLTEVKQRLDRLLGCAISTNSLFNQPTMEALITHLYDEVLPELFADSATTQITSPPTAQITGPVAADRALVDDLLQSLYQV